MDFKELYVNTDDYYSVGIDQDSGSPVLMVIVTWTAWFERYFRLNDREYRRFQKNNECLTRLVRKLAKYPLPQAAKTRLLYSQKTEEND